MDIIKRRSEQLTNKELQKATNYIIDRGRNIQENICRIASKLYEIMEKNLYLDDGFENITDYADKVLGIKKSQCYNLLNIAERFIDPEQPKHSTLKQDHQQDFNKSQLIAMLPLDIARTHELVNDGVIDSTMSVRKIKAIVNKQFDNHAEDTEEENTQDEKVEVITAYNGELFINADCGIDLQDIYNFIVNKMNNEKEVYDYGR